MNADENVHRFAIQGDLLVIERERIRDREREIEKERERNRDKKHDTKSVVQKALPKVKSWNCRIRWANKIIV